MQDITIFEPVVLEVFYTSIYDTSSTQIYCTCFQPYHSGSNRYKKYPYLFECHNIMCVSRKSTFSMTSNINVSCVTHKDAYHSETSIRTTKDTFLEHHGTNCDAF